MFDDGCRELWPRLVLSSNNSSGSGSSSKTILHIVEGLTRAEMNEEVRAIETEIRKRLPIGSQISREAMKRDFRGQVRRRKGGEKRHTVC